MPVSSKLSLKITSNFDPASIHVFKRIELLGSIVPSETFLVFVISMPFVETMIASSVPGTRFLIARLFGLSIINSALLEAV